MFTTLKTWANSSVKKIDEIFSSSESEIYIADLRKVVTHKGKKCKFPKNYHEVVKFGKIKKDDKDGSYKLVYKGKDFPLAIVETTDKNTYVTIDFLVDPKERDFRNDSRNTFSKYYKPFGLSKIDLKKHIPVFEIDNTSGKLTNSSLLTKEIKEKGKVKRVVDPEGRNGELLFTTEWKELNPDFFTVRDHNGNLELDKSLLSVLLAFVTYSARVFVGWVTFPFMKIGEWLISQENPVVKAFGRSLYTLAAVVKHLVSFLSIMLRFPILLFVADKEKYGDSYLTMWKHQLEESRQEVMEDLKFIKNGKREKRVKKDYPEFKAGGTWEELNAIRTVNEKKLEEYEQDPDKYKEKYHKSVSPVRSESTEIVNQLKEASTAKKDPVTEQEKINNTVTKEETMCATTPAPAPAPAKEGQNTSSPTPELGNSNNKQESHLGRQQSRRNSQSSITTPPRN